MKPWVHAESSARRWGGTPEDYIEIHNLMDSSKAAIADNRHRALTHNSWFIGTILEKVFGVTFTNSAGRTISVRQIGEDHVLEDFRGRFIPTAQDFLQEIEFKEWFASYKEINYVTNEVRGLARQLAALVPVNVALEPAEGGGA